MNWEAIGAIGETIGAIAVVLTLVYLSIQIRQNTRSVRAATYQSVAEALADCSYKLVGHMQDEDSDRRLLFIGTISLCRPAPDFIQQFLSTTIDIIAL